jgi:branched-chain amino acid transport system ATP-binding protein
VSDEPALDVRGVTVRFGGVFALRSVDLALAHGEIRGLIGPNGAGKTTLFDCIAGINRPTEGSIRFRGEDITRRSPVWRSRHGMRRTFQRQQVFGWLSVEDNVLAALEWRGGGGGTVADLTRMPTRARREAERRARVDEVLEMCGLVDVRAQHASSLPIGQARLLEMARAIVDRPSLLLLDEPTSGLAERETMRLGELVRTIRVETGCSVLLVEHDVAFVMAHCDRVSVLDLGEVLAEGPPEAIAADAAVRSAYLG